MGPSTISEKHFLVKNLVTLFLGSYLSHPELWQLVSFPFSGCAAVRRVDCKVNNSALVSHGRTAADLTASRGGSRAGPGTGSPAGSSWFLSSVVPKPSMIIS